MTDFIYNRTVTVSRSSVTNDSTNGARMVPAAIITGMSCSIQPGRNRLTLPSHQPNGIKDVSVDAMPEWKLFCLNPDPVVPMLKNDVVSDDLSRTFRLDEVYSTPLGTMCNMSTIQP